MKTIPPAETFIINKMKHYPSGTPPTPKDVEEWLIEFAKMHVEEALKEAKETLYIEAGCNVCNCVGEIFFNSESITNSYPSFRIE